MEFVLVFNLPKKIVIKGCRDYGNANGIMYKR